MDTEILKAERPEDVARAARLLTEGAVVAFPTETVYGLGALADDADAITELRHLKARPEGKEFTLLVSSPQQAWRLGTAGPAARALADAFWPGPLTLVIPDGAGGYVGARCPDCDVTLALLREVGAAVAGPSANLGGEEPARDAGQVMATFAGRIAAVLDGGPVELGVASTVVRAVGESIEVLREGAIPEPELRAALSRAGLGE